MRRHPPIGSPIIQNVEPNGHQEKEREHAHTMAHIFCRWKEGRVDNGKHYLLGMKRTSDRYGREEH